MRISYVVDFYYFGAMCICKNSIGHDDLRCFNFFISFIFYDKNNNVFIDFFKWEILIILLVKIKNFLLFISHVITKINKSLQITIKSHDFSHVKKFLVKQ